MMHLGAERLAQPAVVRVLVVVEDHFLSRSAPAAPSVPAEEFDRALHAGHQPVHLVERVVHGEGRPRGRRRCRTGGAAATRSGGRPAPPRRRHRGPGRRRGRGCRRRRTLTGEPRSVERGRPDDPDTGRSPTARPARRPPARPRVPRRPSIPIAPAGSRAAAASPTTCDVIGVPASNRCGAGA